MISKRMAWLAQRQRVLAQNISNADTPRYKAKDLEELDFDKILRQTRFRSFSMKASNPAHLAGSTTEATRPNKYRIIEQKTDYETALMGNSVSLEEQLMASAQTAMDYEMTTNLYKKHLQMFRDAIGRIR